MLVNWKLYLSGRDRTNLRFNRQDGDT